MNTRVNNTIPKQLRNEEENPESEKKKKIIIVEGVTNE